MKASEFSEAQIALVLKQAEDGAAIGEACRKAGHSALNAAAIETGGGRAASPQQQTARSRT